MITTMIWACSKADASMVHHPQVQVSTSTVVNLSPYSAYMPTKLVVSQPNASSPSVSEVLFTFSLMGNRCSKFFYYRFFIKD